MGCQNRRRSGLIGDLIGTPAGQNRQIEQRKGRIVIVGGTGFIGRSLVSLLSDWDVAVLSRRDRALPGARVMPWDPEHGALPVLSGAAAIVNLSGAPVTLPWTPENRRTIVDSRVRVTKAIAAALAEAADPPAVWVNGSAVGFYGDRGEEILEETASRGNGFLADVCAEWEAALFEPELPVRRVALRTGVALGPDGGALGPLKRLARLGLGGSAGAGKQWVPWIHLRDLSSMIRWAILTESVSGPLNGCAPEPVRNRDLMRMLRTAVHRPWSPPAPTLAIRALANLGGPDPSLILSSQRAVPRQALEAGFQWGYPNLAGALEHLLASRE